MGGCGTALAVLFVLLAGVGVAMATGNGGFISHMASSARGNADLFDDDADSDEADFIRQSPGMKSAMRRLRYRSAWRKIHEEMYPDDDGTPHIYCFGKKCKDSDDESDEE